MEGWEESKRRADRHTPEVAAICGVLFVCEPVNVEEDWLRNTDLVVLSMDRVRIGVRIRGHEYLARYPEEFTIRAARPKSGNDTELTKILRGWGDYLFYGFANEHDTGLAFWRVVNLREFALWYNRQLFMLPAGKAPGILKPNKDGSSEFYAFSAQGLTYASGEGGIAALLARKDCISS